MTRTHNRRNNLFSPDDRDSNERSSSMESLARSGLSMTSHDQLETPDPHPGRGQGYVTSGILLAVIAAILWIVPDVLLLIFASILAAIILHTLGSAIAEAVSIPLRPGIGTACLLLILSGAAAVWVFSPQIASQSEGLAEELSDLSESWGDLVSRSQIAAWVDRILPDAEEMEQAGGFVINGLGGVFTSTFGAVVNAVLIAVVGLYLSLETDRYSRGFRRLFPYRYRDRVKSLQYRLVATLKGWLMGQLFSMAVLGVGVFVGLSLLGVPMALLFALITALLTFIPNLGPFLSVIPPTLVALAKDPWLALWVLVFYLCIQFIEGNFLTPMVMRHVISMPPALLLTCQIVFAGLFGFWGLLLAAPLTVVAMILVQELHMKSMDAMDGRPTSA